MYALTDDMLITLLGQEMHDYCIDKSKELCNGNALYDVILCAAIGKLIKDNALLKAQLNQPKL